MVNIWAVATTWDKVERETRATAERVSDLFVVAAAEAAEAIELVDAVRPPVGPQHLVRILQRVVVLLPSKVGWFSVN